MFIRRLAFIGLTTCACVPLQQGKEMQAQLDAMHQQLQAAQRNADMRNVRFDEQMARADTKIAQVSATLQELKAAARSTDADLGIRLEEVIRELQEIRGGVEMADFRLRQLEDGRPGKSDDEATNVVDALPVAKTGAEALEQARTLIQAKRISEARGVLLDLLKRWPKEAGVTDHAQMELGQLHLADKEHRTAMQVFIQLVETFPKSPLMPAAYFHIGVCSKALGAKEDARVFFGEVIQKYGDSPWAEPAKKELTTLSRRRRRKKNR